MFHVTEHELNLVTSYAGTGTRQMPADFAVPAQGPARLAATAIEFLLRGTQCTELTRTRIVLLEFIEQSFTLICRRHFNIDISDMHTQSPPPLPFLDGEENAKLRLVRHTFEKNGDGRIAQIAKKILEFQFTEPQDRVNKQNYTMGWHVQMTGISGPISHQRSNRAVITRVELRPDLPQGTVAYTLNVGSMRWTGKIILLPRIIAVLPLLWGFIAKLTPLRSNGREVVFKVVVRDINFFRHGHDRGRGEHLRVSFVLGLKYHHIS
ncbi:hypothetical protein K438DRAFT_804099 [Mycena galopus ATCC 62051]|nr:hypothetical protein K438DRAFT_804099 [Mycena galopus ATCC 62051]